MFSDAPHPLASLAGLSQGRGKVRIAAPVGPFASPLGEAKIALAILGEGTRRTVIGSPGESK